MTMVMAVAVATMTTHWAIPAIAHSVPQTNESAFHDVLYSFTPLLEETVVVISHLSFKTWKT